MYTQLLLFFLATLLSNVASEKGDVVASLTITVDGKDVTMSHLEGNDPEKTINLFCAEHNLNVNEYKSVMMDALLKLIPVEEAAKAEGDAVPEKRSGGLGSSHGEKSQQNEEAEGTRTLRSTNSASSSAFTAETSAEGADLQFLRDYAGKRESHVLDSGLMYVKLVEQENDDDVVGVQGRYCSIPFETWTVDEYPNGTPIQQRGGHLLNVKHRTGRTFKMANKGLFEALSMMKVGEQWEVVAPPELNRQKRVTISKVTLKACHKTMTAVHSEL